jgi:hypothetical protein
VRAQCLFAVLRGEGSTEVGLGNWAVAPGVEGLSNGAGPGCPPWPKGESWSGSPGAFQVMAPGRGCARRRVPSVEDPLTATLGGEESPELEAGKVGCCRRYIGSLEFSRQRFP